MKAQELIIGHLLPITLAIAVLWIAYRLLLRNKRRYTTQSTATVAAMGNT